MSKKFFRSFGAANAKDITDALKTGLMGYSVVFDQAWQAVSSVWLFLGNETVLNIRSTMHDVEPTKSWEEIGTLIFVFNNNDELVPPMIPLKLEWHSDLNIQKLVYECEDYLTESGLVVMNRNGDEFCIVTSSAVCMLTIKSPFFSEKFTPEREYSEYSMASIL